MEYQQNSCRIWFVLIILISISNIFCEGAIGGDIQSTLKIGQAICNPKILNHMIAKMFFGCYDYAPGKEQFVTCQRRIYGQDLSTVRGICNLCRSTGTGKLSEYGGCLGQEFNAGGINMNEAVTKINQCQAVVLGIS